MPPYLMDAVGYDSIEVREAARELGWFKAGTAVVDWLRHAPQWKRAEQEMKDGFEAAMHAAETYSQCEVCGMLLSPYSVDPNHHVSMFETPLRHFCAEHCPACSPESTEENGESFFDFVARELGGVAREIPDDEDEEDFPDEDDDDGWEDGYIWSED